MSHRSWRSGNPVAQFLAGLAFIVILILWAYDLGRDKGEAVGEYAANSDTYAREANKEIEERCLALEGVDMAACIQDVVESVNEHERAERDLIAQMDAARWGFAILIVSAVGTALGIIGTYLIYKTFAATRDAVNEAGRANEIALHASIASERAWLTLTPPSILKVNYAYEEIGAVPQHIMLTWTTKLTNTGKTPALNAVLRGGVVLAPFDDEVDRMSPPMLAREVSEAPIAIGPGEVRDIAMTRRARIPPSDDSSVGVRRIIVALSLWYDVAGDQQRRMTWANYMLVNNSDDPASKEMIVILPGSLSRLAEAETANLQCIYLASSMT